MRTYNPLFLLIFLLSMGTLSAQWDSLGYKHKALQVIPNVLVHDQIEVDAEGNIFLLGKKEGLLYKYLASDNYDSVIFVGGISTRQGGFLHPEKLSLKNRQDFYLLDDLGRKIILFDKELKIIETSDFFAISSNSGTGISDEFEPQSFDISTSGETFVLNRSNNKVYKINAFGSIESAFGGLDYGEGSIYQPKDIQVSPDNLIYISESEDQILKVYDMYGIYLESIQIALDWSWENFHVHESFLIFWNESNLCLLNRILRKSQRFELEKSIRLKDLFIGREIIYLLLENEVHLYPIKE